MPVDTPATLNRRHLLGTALAAAGTTAAMHGPFGLPLVAAQATANSHAGRKYPFKKSINLWAFPYPQKMSLDRMPATREGRRV